MTGCFAHVISKQTEIGNYVIGCELVHRKIKECELNALILSLLNQILFFFDKMESMIHVYCTILKMNSSELAIGMVILTTCSHLPTGKWPLPLGSNFLCVTDFPKGEKPGPNHLPKSTITCHKFW